MSSEQLLVTVGLSATKFKNEMKDLNSNLKNTEKNFKITEKSAQLMENKVEGLSKKISSLNTVYEAQNKKLEAYKKRTSELAETKSKLITANEALKTKLAATNKEYENAVKVYGENSKQAKSLKTELNSLEKDIAKHDKAIQSTTKQYDHFTREMKTTELEAGYTQQRINSLEKEVEGLGGKVSKVDLSGFKAKLESVGNTATNVARKFNDIALKAVGGGITAIGGAITGLGSVVTGVGATMTAAFTIPFNRMKKESLGVLKEFETSLSSLQAVTGASGKEMEVFEKKILELGGSTQKSSMEVAEAMRYQALAGWDQQQILESTLPILNLSIAGNMDLARSSDLVTDSMGGLKLEVKDLPGYLDKVAQTSRKSNTNMDQMMEAMIVAAGSANVLGINTTDLSAALGVLANEGYKGAEGGRALQTSLNRIAANKQVKQALKDIGVSVFDASGQFRGMETVLGELNLKFKDMNQEQKAHYAKIIAGENYYSQFITLVDSMGGSYQNLKKDIENSNGVLDEMTAIMGDNLEGKIKRTESAFEGFQIALGKSARPAATLKADLAYFILNGFNKLPEPIKVVVLALLNFIAAIGPVIAIIGALITVIGLVVTKLGIFIMGLAGVAAPMTAIIYLAYILIQTFQKFKDEILAAFQKVSDAVGEQSTLIQFHFSTLWNVCKDIWDTVGSVLMNIMRDLIVGTCDVIAGIFPSISNAFGIVVNILADLWYNYGEPLFTAIEEIIKIAVDFVVACLPGISNAFDIVMGVLKSIYENVCKPIFDGIMAVVDMVVAWCQENMPKIAQVFNSVMDSMKKFWDKVGKPLWEIIKIIIEGVIQSCLPFIKKLLDRFGVMVDGISKFWNSIGKPVFDTLLEVCGWLVSKAVPLVRDFKDKVVEAMNMVTSPIQWVIDKFKSLKDWVGRVSDSVGNFLNKINPFKSISAPEIQGVMTYSLETPDVDFNHQLYSASTPLSMGLNNVLNSSKNTTDSLLKELINITKEVKVNNDASPIVIKIENFNNNRETDIQTLSEELEFYRKNSRLRGV